MELWQRFTSRARRAVLLAHSEATRSGREVIGTEHILLGLLRLGEGTAVEVLEHLGANVERLREDLEERTQSGPAGELNPEITFSPEAQQVLQLAYAEARLLKDAYIGTEHILMGLLRLGKGPAYRLLKNCGAELTPVRHIVAEMGKTRGASRDEALEQLRIGPSPEKAIEHYSRLPVEKSLGKFDKVFEVEGRYVNDHCLIFHEGLHHLYYIDGEVGKGCYDLGNEIMSGHATSPDLRNWTAQDPALVRDENLEWEERGIYAPYVIEHGGVFYMFYASHNLAKAQYMCLATSADLVNWTRHHRNPLFVPSGQWADWAEDKPCSCRDPHVVKHEDHGFIMYWVADMKQPPDHSCIAASVSKDLVFWQEIGPVLIRHHSDLELHTCKTESPCVVRLDDVQFLFYRHGAGTKVCSSNDPLDFHGRDSVLFSTAHAAEVFQHQGQWHVTSCSRPPEDVFHEQDRQHGLYLGKMTWTEDGWPEVV